MAAEVRVFKLKSQLVQGKWEMTRRKIQLTILFVPYLTQGGIEKEVRSPSPMIELEAQGENFLPFSFQIGKNIGNHCGQGHKD